MTRARIGPRALLSTLLLAVAPVAPVADDVVAPDAAEPVLARVAAQEGHAVAVRVGAPARTLACGDAVRAGERVRTAGGAHIVLASEGAGAPGWSAHLPGASEVALGRAEEGGPAFAIHAGAARLLDDRAAGAPLRWVAPSGLLAVRAPDVEWVRRHDGSLRVCAWDASGAAVACHLHAPDGSARRVTARTPEVDLLRGGFCGARRDLVRAADFASPPPVSAPGPVSYADLFEIAVPMDPPTCGGASDECSGSGGLEDIVRDPEPLTVAPPPPALPPF